MMRNQARFIGPILPFVGGLVLGGLVANKGGYYQNQGGYYYPPYPVYYYPIPNNPPSSYPYPNTYQTIPSTNKEPMFANDMNSIYANTPYKNM